MKRILFACLMMLGIMTKAQNGYQIGDVASDFNLKNVDGKSVSLANYKDAKGYIIVFTCNTCPVAQAYQDRVEALNKEYAPKGYPVIAINTNDPIASPGDSYAKMQERAKQKKFSFAYLEDPNHIYTKKYGANKTPHVFILQKTAKGNEVAYIGAIDNDQEEVNPQKETYVQNAINLLLQGKKPTVTYTKAIGCSIRWKKESTTE
ncbi:redoxin domain-containing protein [Pedobacter sp. LMG 31464]|uniref:Redoxin domain-containing protein n=1 Tax=Pedobacter planticolens TaxID=2679964 RepID=A0A923DVJ4_9SPHI|nr:thioredoxin family protein [Pedobacter planticolens]MBB2144726.1 redoxin domain-containing protein [Pedobacter planticolens]